MSTEALNALQRIRAFDPTIRFEELGSLHVPFDEMHSTTNVENRLAAAAVQAERVALIGTTGNGKSSTASYVINASREEIIAFRIGVTVEDPDLLTHPGRFAQYVVRRIARDAIEVSEPERVQLQLEVADTRQVNPERSRRGAAKINAKVLELSAELGRVYSSVEHKTSAYELIEGLDHALALVRTLDATPVLVIDDSDTWLEVDDARLQETRRAFFGPVMRMLADRDCGLIVAVDERYVGLPEYRPARDGNLPTEISVPRVRELSGLVRLLTLRVAQLEGAEISDVFEGPAIEDIFAAYEARNLSLRALMRCVNSGLYHAGAAGADRVGTEAFAASLREYVADSPA